MTKRDLSRGALRRTIVAAVALGAAWLGSYLGYRTLAMRGWPATDRLPDHWRADHVQHFLPLGPDKTAWMALLAPVGLVLIWSLLESLLRLDPDHVCWRSLRWTGRALTRRPGLDVVAWYALLALLGFWLQPFVFALLSLMGSVLVPFAILRVEVASAESRPRWWRPRWPGALPLLTALLILPSALLAVLAACQDYRFLGAPGAVLASVLGLLVCALLSPALAAVLLFRLGPREAWLRLPAAFQWARLGPLVVLQARVVYVYLWTAAPLALGFLLLWRNVPLAEQFLAGQGQSVPWTAHRMLETASLLSRLAVPLLALPIAVLYLLPLGRMLWLLRPEASDG